MISLLSNGSFEQVRVHNDHARHTNVQLYAYRYISTDIDRLHCLAMYLRSVSEFQKYPVAFTRAHGTVCIMRCCSGCSGWIRLERSVIAEKMRIRLAVLMYV